MLLLIATVALLALAGWAGVVMAKHSLLQGLLVAALPLIGIGAASVTGQPLAAFAALLPLGYFAYKNMGSKQDILIQTIGLVLAVWLWTHAADRARVAASAAYEAQVAEFRKRSEADAANAAQTVAQWPARAVALTKQRGKLSLGDTGAELEVPAHWRYIDAEPLREALSGTRHFPGLGVLGWLVHERVDLVQLDTIWYVEVYAEQRGHVKAAGVDDSDLERRKGEATARINAKGFAAGAPSFSFVKFVEAPKYDAEYDRAVWVDQMSYPGETSLLLDCYAIKIGKEAQVWFRMREQFAGAQELCTLSVRLMAAKTRFVSGAAYADYSWPMDDNSGFDLGEVIAGEHRVDD